MRELTGLVYLDFLTIKKTALSFSIIFLFFVVFGFVLQPLFFVFLAFIAGYLTAPSFTVAEQSGYNRLYGMIPVSRTKIAFARFISTFIIMFAVIVLSSLLAEISGALKIWERLPDLVGNFPITELYDTMKEYEITVFDLSSIILPVCCLILLAEYPLTFLLGSEKSIYASFFSIGGIIAIGFAVNKIAGREKIGEWITFLCNSFIDHKAIFVICCYLISFVLLAIGASISALILNRKEL